MPKKHVLEIYSHTPTHCIGCVDVSGEESTATARAPDDAGGAGAPAGTAPTYAGARGGAPRDRRSLALPWAALRVSLALGVRRDLDGKVVDYRIEVTLLHRPRAGATVTLRDARTNQPIESFDADLAEGLPARFKGTLPFAGTTDFSADAFLADAPDVTARDDAFIHVPKTLGTADSGTVELLFSVPAYEEYLDDLVVVTSERLGTWSRWVKKEGVHDGDWRTLPLPVRPGERCTVRIVPNDAGAGYDLVRDAPFPEDWFDPATPRRIFRGYHRGTKNVKGDFFGRSFLHFAPRIGDPEHELALNVFLFCKFVYEKFHYEPEEGPKDHRFAHLPGLPFEEWRELLRWETETIWSRQHTLVGLEGSVEGKRVRVDVHLPPDDEKLPHHRAWWEVRIENRKRAQTSPKAGMMWLDAMDVAYKGGGKKPEDEHSDARRGLAELRAKTRLRRDAYLSGAHEMGHALGLPDEYEWQWFLATGRADEPSDMHVPGAPYAHEHGLMASGSNRIAPRLYWPWAAWLHGATRWRWGVGADTATAFAYDAADPDAPFRPDAKPASISSVGSPSKKRWASFRLYEYTLPPHGSAYAKIYCAETRLRVLGHGVALRDKTLIDFVYFRADPLTRTVVECEPSAAGSKSLLVFDVHVKFGGKLDFAAKEIEIPIRTDRGEVDDEIGLLPPERVHIPGAILSADAFNVGAVLWHVAGHGLGLADRAEGGDCSLLPSAAASWLRPRPAEEEGPLMRIPLDRVARLTKEEAVAVAEGIRGLLEADRFTALELADYPALYTHEAYEVP